MLDKQYFLAFNNYERVICALISTIAIMILRCLQPWFSMYFILNVCINMYILDILYLKDIPDTTFRYHQLTRLTQGAIL